MLYWDSKKNNSYLYLCALKRDGGMKKYIIYCMIALLATLLYNKVSEVAILSAIPTHQETEECCILLPATTTQQSIWKICEHLSTVSVCMEHTDNPQVPGNKVILLRDSLLKMQQNACLWGGESLSYTPPSLIPDTHDYLFGLRKIII